MKLIRAAYHAMAGFAGGELDLRGVPPGLVTLTGPNWQGKTTLLELPLAAWYREWASRETNDISRWADARDAWVECDLDLGGVIYRARVQIDGLSRKMQAVVSQLGPDGTWRVLTDGKVSTFDEKVAELLPPKEAVLCAQFSAQNRAGSLTGASRAKRKDLFIQFLWLERLIAMGETAKQCYALAETTGRLLRRQMTDLAQGCTAEDEASLVAALEEATARVAELEASAAAWTAQLMRLEADRQALGERVAAGAIAKGEAKQLAQAVAETEAARAAITGQREKVRRQAETDRETRQARYDKAEAAIQATMATLEARLAQAEAIREAAARGEAIRREADQIRQRLMEIPAEEQLIERRQRDRRAAALLQQVPCGGGMAVVAGTTVDLGACQFIRDARAAADRLGGRRSDDEAGPLQALKAERESLQGRLQALQGQLTEVGPLADQAQALAVATARRAEAERQREELARRQAEEEAEAERRVADQVAEIDARATELDARVARLRAELAALEVRVRETEAAEAELAALEQTLSETRAQLLEVERQKSAAVVLAEDRRRALERLRARRAAIAAVEPLASRVEARGRQWAILMRALHRDGLPTLEIAAAAPAVSQLTTDLLEHSGFGSRFRVEVTTLVPTADGHGWKEDFAIRIWDNDRGKELLGVGDLSGGERILVEEALRAALTLYMSSRQPHQVRTCWRDETTGPLDAENRPRYIAMLRRLRQLGQYDHVLYVSHAEDAVEAADTIFEVRQGTVQARRRG